MPNKITGDTVRDTLHLVIQALFRCIDCLNAYGVVDVSRQLWERRIRLLQKYATSLILSIGNQSLSYPKKLQMHLSCTDHCRTPLLCMKRSSSWRIEANPLQYNLPLKEIKRTTFAICFQRGPQNHPVCLSVLVALRLNPLDVYFRYNLVVCLISHLLRSIKRMLPSS